MDESDLTFSRDRRLRKPAEFDRVFRRRSSRADHSIVVYSELNSLAETRLGLVVSKKVGNAVVRNLWKRRLREAFRLEREQLPRGIDLVIIPRRQSNHKTPTLVELRKSLRKLTPPRP